MSETCNTGCTYKKADISTIEMTASMSFSQPALIPNICNTQHINPNTQLEKIPYNITGPAMVNILQPMPNT